MNQIRRLAAPFAFSVLVGSVIALLSFVAAWRNMRGYLNISKQQSETVYSLRRLNRGLKDEKETRGVFPHSLRGFGDYGAQDFGSNQLADKTKSVPLDGWNRPFEYSTFGDSYLVTSLGRDGKLGGVGLDCDLTSLQSKPPQSALTFLDFYAEPATKNVRDYCMFLLLITPFALLFGFATPNTVGEEPKKISYWEMAVSGLIILFFSVSFAAIASILELPTGH